MSQYRTRNQLLLAKAEAVSGTEETPTPAENAVKVRFPIEFTPNLEQNETDYVTGSLSGSAPIAGGGVVTMAMRAFLKGAGSGGVAPDVGILLRGCGMSETLTAAPITGTAQAGAAGTITLEAGSSSVDDIYVGMPIEITAGTGSSPSQKFRVITAYDGTTKQAAVYPDWSTPPDNTSTYNIPANALYRPIGSGLETLTLHQYQHRNVGDSKLRRLKGAAGNFNMRVAPRVLAELNLNFSGQLTAAPSDVTPPADPTYQQTDPTAFLSAQSFLAGTPINFSQFTFDLGATVDAFDNPTEAFGFDPFGVTGRPQPGGTITPTLSLNSERNVWQDMLDGDLQDLWLNWGPAVGNRISIYLPKIRFTNVTGADIRGFAAEAITYRTNQPNGEIFYCAH